MRSKQIKKSKIKIHKSLKSGQNFLYGICCFSNGKFIKKGSEISPKVQIITLYVVGTYNGRKEIKLDNEMKALDLFKKVFSAEQTVNIEVLVIAMNAELTKFR